jgi:molecular chaperone DnaK (HSP70)
MKKITPTDEEIKQIKTMFVDELKGLREISKKFNWSTFTISRILKENGVSIKGSGRKFLGGKKIADKKYRQKNKEKIDNYVKDWYEQNKEHRKQYLKEYRENNIDKIRETKRNYERTRKANDPIYKLINNFRTAIYQVLKENQVQKNGHYFDILKYSPENLIEHLENKFKDNMTWDNYGEWHVDHIKPISSFKITEIGDKEFMSCWSLENLQPLWGKENIRKSNKL